MDEILSVFSVEAREQLEAMEAGLMQLEQGDRDPETINAVFRAAHTIKGGAGVVEIHSVEKFTHVLENVLDRLRNGEIEVSGDMISALLLGCDHIGALLGVVQTGDMEPDAELKQAGDAITDSLRPFLGAKAPAGGKEVSANADGNIERDSRDSATSDCWHISVRFGHDVLRNGMEPLAFLRYLLNLGEIAHITTLTDALPAADEMDPESCYLGFEINFRSHASKEARLVEDCRRLGQPARRGAAPAHGADRRGVQIRFPRVVRDVSRELGKDIELKSAAPRPNWTSRWSSASATRSCICCATPWTTASKPLPRSAAAGKPARGTVSLAASHESGSIVIEVRDDGRGLDRERILKKAIEKGWCRKVSRWKTARSTSSSCSRVSRLRRR
jgi:chemotaxis protein histidine kinase CheA